MWRTSFAAQCQMHNWSSITAAPRQHAVLWSTRPPVLGTIRMLESQYQYSADERRLVMVRILVSHDEFGHNLGSRRPAWLKLAR